MTLGGVLAGGVAVLVLAGCSAMCVCTDTQHMRSARVSVWAARVGADADDFLQACQEACAQ